MNLDRYKMALVTGASSGFGSEFARQLADQGVALILTGRNQPRLDSLVESLGGLLPVRAVRGDLAQPEFLAKICQMVQDEPIDLLINSAGIGQVGGFEEIDAERMQETVDINIKALISLTQTAYKKFVAQNHGGIINIASTVGYLPMPYFAVYAASKAFVKHFSEALSAEAEEAETEVTITCLCPGMTDTEFLDHIGGLGREKIKQDTTGFAMMGVKEAVTDCLDGFYSGRSIVVPGRLNRAYLTLSRLIPDKILRSASAGIMKRMIG